MKRQLLALAGGTSLALAEESFFPPLIRGNHSFVDLYPIKNRDFQPRLPLQRQQPAGIAATSVHHCCGLESSKLLKCCGLSQVMWKGLEVYREVWRKWKTG